MTPQPNPLPIVGDVAPWHESGLQFTVPNPQDGWDQTGVFADLEGMEPWQYLLCCVAEECCEVAQRALKAARFGIAEVQPGQPLDNEARLRAELADLTGVLEFAIEAGHLQPGDLDRGAIDAKKEKLRKFMAYSKGCGTLKPEQ